MSSWLYLILSNLLHLDLFSSYIYIIRWADCESICSNLGLNAKSGQIKNSSQHLKFHDLEDPTYADVHNFSPNHLKHSDLVIDRMTYCNYPGCTKHCQSNCHGYCLTHVKLFLSDDDEFPPNNGKKVSKRRSRAPDSPRAADSNLKSPPEEMIAKLRNDPIAAAALDALSSSEDDVPTTSAPADCFSSAKKAAGKSVKPLYNCPDCDKKNLTKNGLAAHFGMKHGGTVDWDLVKVVNAPLPAKSTAPCPEIGVGWTMQKVMRSKSTASDKYFISPDGRKFRSMAEVNRYLNGETSPPRKKSPKKNKAAPASAHQKPKRNGKMIPIRQYYHSQTNLPMPPGDWDIDSDDEVDDTWLRNMSADLLDDLEDVSSGEKKFMHLWNDYIRCNHVIPDRDIAGKCHEFVLKHGRELHEGDGLRLNLLLHLFNLWDSGVISSKRILSCMSIYDEHGNDDDNNIDDDGEGKKDGSVERRRDGAATS